MVTPAKFATIALGFPEAVQGTHFDVTDFRVRGRIFATLREKDGRAVLKLASDQQRLLMETPAVSSPRLPGHGDSRAGRK